MGFYSSRQLRHTNKMKTEKKDSISDGHKREQKNAKWFSKTRLSQRLIVVRLKDYFTESERKG